MQNKIKYLTCILYILVNYNNINKFSRNIKKSLNFKQIFFDTTTKLDKLKFGQDIELFMLNLNI
jgi:hypothetical protein